MSEVRRATLCHVRKLTPGTQTPAAHPPTRRAQKSQLSGRTRRVSKPKDPSLPVWLGSVRIKILIELKTYNIVSYFYVRT